MLRPTGWSPHSKPSGSIRREAPQTPAKQEGDKAASEAERHPNTAAVGQDGNTATTQQDNPASSEPSKNTPSESPPSQPVALPGSGIGARLRELRRLWPVLTLAAIAGAVPSAGVAGYVASRSAPTMPTMDAGVPWTASNSAGVEPAASDHPAAAKPPPSPSASEDALCAELKDVPAKHNQVHLLQACLNALCTNVAIRIDGNAGDDTKTASKSCTPKSGGQAMHKLLHEVLEQGKRCPEQTGASVSLEWLRKCGSP